MANKTQIANLSLTHLGIGHQIANIDSERSEEANAINSVYDIARDSVLIDFPWPFLTKSASLALVESDPTTEWDFSYRYPSDSLKIRRIFSAIRNDNRQSRVPFLFYQDAVEKLIYTDCEDAKIEYSARQNEEGRWPADFALAFSFLLAVLIAPRLAKGDTKLRKDTLALYQAQISAAEQRAINEEQAEQVPESEFVRAREEDVTTPGTKQSFNDFIGN